MEFETFMNFFFSFMSILSVYLIYKAIKGWDPNYKPGKLTARVIRAALGYKGSRIFTGVMGSLLLALWITMLLLTNTSFRPSFADKTDMFEITCGTGFAANNIENVNNLNYGAGAYKREQITGLSFKNNYLKEVPEVVWNIENLKILNLANNKIKKIDLEGIRKLKQLDTLIITGTPIAEDNLQQISSTMNVHIVR